MTSMLRKVFLGFAFSLSSGLSLAQLAVAPIDGTTITANSLASSLLGVSSGITINSATYTGANIASGTFSGGTGIIGIANGILLTSGLVNNVVGPNDNDATGQDNELPGDTDLTALAGAETYDASVLTITFTPIGNTVQFSYVFGSEEYNEFVGSEFNDVFGFYVNGVNRALIPSTSTPVAINNINCGFAAPGVAPPGPGTNCSLFVNNDPATHNTQLDGYTVVLTFTATVNPGVPNTLKIAIADTSDHIYDSAVFIERGSFLVCGGPGQPACVSPRSVLPVYRFFNNNAGGHFYTINEAEKDTVIQNYNWFRYEGTGFNASPVAQPGMLPVYRFFNNNAGGHFYTINEAEKDTVIQNYNWFRYEGIGFYASTVQLPGTLPLYRFFNNNAGGHFYTINEAEKDTVIQNYNWFRYEGVGFYAYPSQ